jgi:hypothetical protein
MYPKLLLLHVVVYRSQLLLPDWTTSCCRCRCSYQIFAVLASKDRNHGQAREGYAGPQTTHLETTMAAAADCRSWAG